MCAPIMRWIVGCLAHELRELTHHGELLVAVERTSVREHLYPYVVPFTVHVREAAGRHTRE